MIHARLFPEQAKLYLDVGRQHISDVAEVRLVVQDGKTTATIRRTDGTTLKLVGTDDVAKAEVRKDDPVDTPPGESELDKDVLAWHEWWLKHETKSTRAM